MADHLIFHRFFLLFSIRDGFFNCALAYNPMDCTIQLLDCSASNFCFSHFPCKEDKNHIVQLLRHWIRNALHSPPFRQFRFYRWYQNKKQLRKNKSNDMATVMRFIDTHLTY